MPRLPQGYGIYQFGVGLFVPVQIPLTVAPQQAIAWPPVRVTRGNYAWVQGSNVALLTNVEAVPARVGAWPEAYQPPRISYGWAFQGPPPPMEDVPYGKSAQALIPRPEWPRSLRTWLVSVQPSPAVVVVQPVPARADWPPSLQPPRPDYTYIQSVNVALTSVVAAAPFAQFSWPRTPVPEYPRSLRTWLQTQIYEEPMPVGEAAQALVARPEWTRSLRTWLQEPFYEEQAPVGEAVQVLVRRPDFLLGLRFWSQGIANILTEEPQPAGEAAMALVARPEWPRGLRTWTRAQTLEEPIPPFQISWARPPVAPRRDYWYAQSTGVVLTTIVEQPPVGESVQTLVRWAPYPLNLRTWTKSQTLEEGMPVGEATMQRLRDPEYLRSLRSWSAAKIFEETMPPRPGDWPRITRPRGSYNWVQATNIALLQLIAPPPIVNDWKLVRPYPRGVYNWVQATNIALLTTPILQIPPGKATFRRTPEPDLWRLRSFSSSQGATAPIIPPFVPPPPPPSGRYRALADIYLPDGRYIEAGEIFTGPPGWIPAVGVDPIDTNAIQAYWDAGPATMRNAEDDIALGPWGLWDRRAGRILPARVYWTAAGNGLFILTSDGAPLGPKAAP